MHEEDVGAGPADADRLLGDGAHGLDLALPAQLAGDGHAVASRQLAGRQHVEQLQRVGHARRRTDDRA